MKKKNKGFTLIELMAVMFIMAILGSVILSLFNSSNRMLIESNVQNILQDEGRIVLDAIENDLKVAKKNTVKIIQKENNFDIIFEENSGGKYIYRSDLNNKKLYKIKINNENEEIIATPTKNLKKFNINLSQNQYKVEMILEKKNSEEIFNSVITPRNKQS